MDPIDILNGLLGMEGDPSLNEHERKVCLLNRFESECLNGSWDQYIWNSSGDFAEDLQPFLVELGYRLRSRHSLCSVRRWEERFPETGPSGSRGWSRFEPASHFASEFTISSTKKSAGFSRTSALTSAST